jgi:hypothetical protein
MYRNQLAFFGATFVNKNERPILLLRSKNIRFQPGSDCVYNTSLHKVIHVYAKIFANSAHRLYIPVVYSGIPTRFHVTPEQVPRRGTAITYGERTTALNS